MQPVTNNSRPHFPNGREQLLPALVTGLAHDAGDVDNEGALRGEGLIDGNR